MENLNWDNATADDIRLCQTRDTNTVYQMTPFTTLEEWEKFAEKLRLRIRVACGLYPEPSRCPLNPVVTAKTEYPDYIIENIYFEAYPGFFVTGNLYRPHGEGPYPAIACPHGHWANGRFENSSTGSVPARCITFARMGMVAFSYDMVGYNDSLQFSRTWGHAPQGIPIERRRREALWGIHPFGVQLWSSIRVLDFLESLPYVDKNRLACTGASGGGTQTFALTAVDPRVKISAPVNMISHTMQGGCMCENAPLIRFYASNMEIGALMAPRPMLMVSATGDWTKDTPQVEFPAIQKIYELYGAGQCIENQHIDAEHNYNKPSREAVYRFFAKWLLNREGFENFTEPEYQMEPVEKLCVFPDGKLPPNSKTADEIVTTLIADRKNQWEALLPKQSQDLETFQLHVYPVFKEVISAEAPPADQIHSHVLATSKKAGVEESRIIIDVSGQRIRAILYKPISTQQIRNAVVLVSGEGFSNEGSSTPDIFFSRLRRSLLRANIPILHVEVFLTGNSKQRSFTMFPDTFIPTDTACRIQDILTAVAYVKKEFPNISHIHLVGLKNAGIWCLFAGAIDQEIASVVADLNHFDITNDEEWVQQYYIPCIRCIGDIRTACALLAPRPLLMFHIPNTFDQRSITCFYPQNRYKLSFDMPKPNSIVSFIRTKQL